MRLPISYHYCAWRTSCHGLIWTYLTPNVTVADTSVLIARERPVRSHLAERSTPSASISLTQTLSFPPAPPCTGSLNISPKKNRDVKKSSMKPPANNSWVLNPRVQGGLVSASRGAGRTGTQGYIMWSVLALVCRLLCLRAVMMWIHTKGPRRFTKTKELCDGTHRDNKTNVNFTLGHRVSCCWQTRGSQRPHIARPCRTFNSVRFYRAGATRQGERNGWRLVLASAAAEPRPQWEAWTWRPERTHWAE